MVAQRPLSVLLSVDPCRWIQPACAGRHPTEADSTTHWYQSKALGVRRGLQVYTPPGYEKSRGKYPTLYLFHGSGDNEATWVAHGNAHWILDNLIAAGRARPMVIVMLDGHAAPPAAPGAATTNRMANTEAFRRDLLEDAMPMVEAPYRVRRDANNRAIIGLSMGGGQSLTVGLNHTDRFAWVGGMSSAVSGGRADGNSDTTKPADPTATRGGAPPRQAPRSHSRSGRRTNRR